MNISGTQQFQRFLRFGHSSGRIDTRGKVKNDLACPQFGKRRIFADHLEFTDTGPGCVRNSLQSFFYQNAVLPFQGNHIRQRTQRHEIKHFFHVKTGAFQRGRKEIVQFGHQKKCNAYPGQGFTRALPELRVTKYWSIRQFRRREMVVRNNHINTELASTSDCGQIRNAAIHGQKQANTFIRELFQLRNIQTVAFTPALRQMPRHGDVIMGEHLTDQRCGCNTVYIVISPYGELLPGQNT